MARTIKIIYDVDSSQGSGPFETYEDAVAYAFSRTPADATITARTVVSGEDD